MPPIVTVIAPGMMGSAVAGRLTANGVLVRTSLTGRSDATVARASYVTGGEMQQSGMVALADKLDHVDCSIDVGGERVTQIRIEIGES